MNAVAELTIKALGDSGVGGLSCYERLLRAAFDAHEPPFSKRWYGETYREQAADPLWLARSLVTNAEKEAEGARVLWQMAGRVASPTIAEQLRRHAIDESNHARYYIAMLHQAFPDCADGEVWQALNEISPGYSARQHHAREASTEDPLVTLDGLVQMNLGEIRTRIHQQLLLPMLMSHIPSERQGPLIGLVEVIIGDETRHIAYTAQVMETVARGGGEDLLREMLFSRVEQFCALTLKEVGTGRFDGA